MQKQYFFYKKDFKYKDNFIRNNEYIWDMSLCMYNIASKIQHHYRGEDASSMSTTENDYMANYSYNDSNHPHAPTDIQVGNKYTRLKHDANGNIIALHSTMNDLLPYEREFTWDEQNRLQKVEDKRTTSHYVYDAGGERVLKRVYETGSVYQSGNLLNTIDALSNYTIYPSGYLVANLERMQYTKHYYANGKRIASRLDKLDPSIFHYHSKASNNANEGEDTEEAPISTLQSLLSVNSANATSSVSDESACQSQLNSLLSMYQGPQWSECRAFLLGIINGNSPCTALWLINNSGYECLENGVPIGGNPYDGIVDDPEVEAPSEEEQNLLDCLNELLLLKAQYYDCKLEAEQNKSRNECCINGYSYIHYNLLDDYSNACDVLDYLKEHYPCFGADNELDTPEEYAPIDDNYTPPSVPDTQPDEESYDESRRKPIWWYHSDHLGSSSYLTDNFGRPSHYYDYLPFGETMVEHNQSRHYRNAYKYNGKELDEVTGMYYYGARYYDPRLSIFISVDPLAEKTFEPYSYVGNNPINMVDPSGLKPVPWYQQFNLWHKLKAGDWYGSENGNVYDPSSFNRASIYNTVNKRSGEYKNIHYRQKYYSWAENRYNSKGHEVKWFSAASKVVKDLQKALLLGGVINSIESGYGSNDRIDKFIKAGNKVILDDVIGRISDLEKSEIILKGNAAKAWDAQTLSNEQAVMQPLYDTMLKEGDVNILNNNVRLNYGENWDPKWDVKNPRHRWTLGMRSMGYKDAKPEDMPKPEIK